MRRPVSFGLALVAIVALVWINYLLCLRLLGLADAKSFADSLSELPQGVKPVTLNGSEPRLLAHAQSVLVRRGFNEEEIKALPTKHELEVEISWIQAANPYPPVLAEYDPGYSRFWNFISFGYIGLDGRYHQITYYGGEADTTPSFLVQKVRGEETGYGDYFVGYLVTVARELRPTPEIVGPDGRVESWREPRVTVERIDWHTYRGGSYNGFEEILVPPLMTLIELLVGIPVLWWFLRRRRRLRGYGENQ